MEIAAITAALSGIKSATDIAKLIKNSGVSLEAAEIKLKLADLIEALADAKIELANVKELVASKEDEIKALEARLSIQGKVVWEEPYYFLMVDDDGKDGPYCQKCYDSAKKLIRLQSPGRNGWWQCHECKSSCTDRSFDAGGIASKGRKDRIDWRGY